MKMYKITMPLDYTAIVTPIMPRITVLDGIASLLNLTGTYYDISSNLDALCKASENIVKVNDAWQTIGKDFCIASNKFAQMNNLCNLPTFPLTLPKHLE